MKCKFLHFLLYHVMIFAFYVYWYNINCDIIVQFMSATRIFSTFPTFPTFSKYIMMCDSRNTFLLTWYDFMSWQIILDLTRKRPFNDFIHGGDIRTATCTVRVRCAWLCFIFKSSLTPLISNVKAKAHHLVHARISSSIVSVCGNRMLHTSAATLILLLWFLCRPSPDLVHVHTLMILPRNWCAYYDVMNCTMIS
jgi:hypothetical protein